ncbi:MAG: hypothetical protein COV72_08235 [Candidatus Omnitrophica bacterium CG11_big_fil_rev_8_21_14_0_20_42_13]|uniref:Uncharacterized protein n=1 Tax=Candidatus Ghiorseimicrobium undicola TaxID=1974746 RepID=A0A2H0LVN4_9BACT|nr:MAG: hypothetical protein COV72_08235 [Candidatus Omnitrophica bacterium CG11_big_fil_rev_8_21_14_0_20_42_13]
MSGSFLNLFLAQAKDWCRGKNPYVRLPFLLGFAYILFRHWLDPMHSDILGWLNWGIHELGHIIFSPFGQFMGITGGEITQFSAPILGMVNFWRQRDFFSIALCFGWLSCSLFKTAAYVADARSISLPMAVPFYSGGDIIHDWNYILTRMGLLDYDIALAVFIKIIASFAMFACFIFGGWLLWRMGARKT